MTLLYISYISNIPLNILIRHYKDTGRCCSILLGKTVSVLHEKSCRTSAPLLLHHHTDAEAGERETPHFTDQLLSSYITTDKTLSRGVPPACYRFHVKTDSALHLSSLRNAVMVCCGNAEL